MTNTMAFMLLPHWPDGCIARMEAFFAAMVPRVHFVTARRRASLQPFANCAHTNARFEDVPYLRRSA